MEAVTSLSKNGKLQVNGDYIGPLKLIVRDQYSGIEGTADLNVLQNIAPSTEGLEISNYEGTKLLLPADCVERPTQVRLSYPRLPDAMRNLAEYSLVSQAYEFSPVGLELLHEAKLTLPVSESVQCSNCQAAWWNSEKLRWETLGGQLFGTDALEVEITDLGRFAVQQNSAPLGISNVRFLPNPFSPITGPLKIIYDLSSNQTSRPSVTIKIYNMAGDFVRTLFDNEPLEKGHREDEWDGLTNSGSQALNGRYVVQMQAKDRSGTKKLLETVVLIK
jgi:hypothetical protein